MNDLGIIVMIVCLLEPRFYFKKQLYDSGLKIFEINNRTKKHEIRLDDFCPDTVID